MKQETGTTPKFKTMATANAESALQELFLDEIMDLYWAENHLVKLLPKMIKAATSPALATTKSKIISKKQKSTFRGWSKYSSY